MLRASGVVLDEVEMTELTHRTEGWAAGLQLAAIGIQEEGDDAGEPVDLARLTGNDQHIADYLRSEYLSRLTPAGLRFLTRTSVLEKMCAPLCNAVLRSKGSARQLEAVEQRTCSSSGSTIAAAGTGTTTFSATCSSESSQSTSQISSQSSTDGRLRGTSRTSIRNPRSSMPTRPETSTTQRAS